jgi:ACS family hexuronate transporter-like MFS transporter
VPAMTTHGYAPIFILAAVIVPLGVAAIWLLGGHSAPVAPPHLSSIKGA